MSSGVDISSVSWVKVGDSDGERTVGNNAPESTYPSVLVCVSLRRAGACRAPSQCSVEHLQELVSCSLSLHKFCGKIGYGLG